MVKRTHHVRIEVSTASTPTEPMEANIPPRRKPGPIPGSEAAKHGGTAAREKYGRDFYSRIGAKGGLTVRDRHGHEFYAEIGQRGGETTKQRLGSEHYSRIGRIGGSTTHSKPGQGRDQGQS